MKALYAEDILLNPVTYELPNPFKVKKFVFSEAPIPEQYKFETMNDFVKEIPMEGYYNKTYIKETLVPEFEFAYNQLTPVIIELNLLINEVQNIIKIGSSPKNFLKLKEGHHYLNIEPHRIFLFYYLFLLHLELLLMPLDCLYSLQD